MNARYARVSRYLPRYPISDMKNPHPIRFRYPIFRTLAEKVLSVVMTNLHLDHFMTCNNMMTSFYFKILAISSVHQAHAA